MNPMKRFVLFVTSVLLFASAGEAAQTQRLAALYKKGEFLQVCRSGIREYYAGRQEAPFAAMVGMACAKSDMINPLAELQRHLVDTPVLRSSATFFSTLVLAKRLLYQHFVDGVSLEPFVLPKYEHILSVVYDHVNRGAYKEMDGGMIRIEHGGRNIFVSVSDDEPARILVDEYEGATLLHRHWYQ